jgi:hypothetical protein
LRKHTDRQTDREKDKQACRQLTHIQANRETDGRNTDRKTDNRNIHKDGKNIQTGRKKDKQTNREKFRKKYKVTDIQRDRRDAGRSFALVQLTRLDQLFWVIFKDDSNLIDEVVEDVLLLDGQRLTLGHVIGGKVAS